MISLLISFVFRRVYIAKKYEIKIGEKFNRLTILKEVEPKFTSGGNKKRMVQVKCDCGTVKEVVLQAVTNGSTKSCGCYNLEKAGNSLRTHNLSGTRLHRIWKDMKRRCNNPNRRNYKDYGGRGITVCEEWQIDYVSFHTWAMENGYTDELSIERIDVNGNYEPSNCEWITMSEQNSNTRRQREFIGIDPDGIVYQGKLIKEFAKIHNLKAPAISDCLNKRQLSHRGWTFKRIDETN